MMNKFTCLAFLTILLASCICKPVTFHKEGDFWAYIRLEADDGKNKTIPPLFIPMRNKNCHETRFCYGEKNTSYRLTVFTKDGILPMEAFFVPNAVKNITVSPTEIRIEKNKGDRE